MFFKPIRDIQWIANNVAVVTSGPGHIDLITLDNTFKLSLRKTIKSIHSDIVREIAVNKAEAAQFVSGGPFLSLRAVSKGPSVSV